MYKAFHIQMRGFQIKSYVGKREKKIYCTSPPTSINITSSEISRFLPEKKTQRGSEVKQTEKHIRSFFFTRGIIHRLCHKCFLKCSANSSNGS